MSPTYYSLKIYNNPQSQTMTPSRYVSESGKYNPSPELRRHLKSMWGHRKSAEIGSLSEMMAKEIITGGQINVAGNRWPLTCVPLRDFANSRAIPLIPDFGIRSDDIITIGSTGTIELIFVTEAKGTTLERGFSHATEAKIFYQLSRTVRMLNKTLLDRKDMKFGGIISVEVNHYARVITLNALDSSAGLATVVPDSWMYALRSSR